jgi:hypothetical protein
MTLRRRSKTLLKVVEKLTKIFCYWPTFHDAEVMDLHFWRGDVNPDVGRYLFPVLTVKLHVWELTNETNAEGYLVLRHHTITTLRFHDVNEFEMDGFNHQNAIFGLSVVRHERSEGTSPAFKVEFASAFGMGASFWCLRVEVIDATPCAEDGSPLPTLNR